MRGLPHHMECSLSLESSLQLPYLLLLVLLLVMKVKGCLHITLPSQHRDKQAEKQIYKTCQILLISSNRIIRYRSNVHALNPTRSRKICKAILPQNKDGLRWANIYAQSLKYYPTDAQAKSLNFGLSTR